MKTPSNELFNLIKSLSPSEKVFFKQFSSRKNDRNNYVILFDAINQMKQYDEEALKTKLKNQPFIKNLKQAKSYTTETLLKSLQEYHSPESIAAKLCNGILQTEILINKRLFSQARKMINKTEKIARENSEHYYLAILLSMKRAVMLMEADQNALKSFSEKEYPEEIRNLEIIRNTTDFNNLDVQMIYATNSRIMAKGGNEKKLIAMLKHPLLQSEEKALSLPAVLKYSNVKATAFTILEDWKKSTSFLESGIRALEKEPHTMKYNASTYFQLMGNLIVSQMMDENWKGVDSTFNKARQLMQFIPEKLKSDRLMHNYFTFQNHYISTLVHHYDFKKVVLLAEELAPDVRRYFSPVSLMIFYYNLFLSYFFLEDHHNSLRAINKILKLQGSELLVDILEECKLQSIIIHYELGNEDMLPGLSRSVRRFFLKKKRLGPDKKILLDFFERILPKVNSAKETQAVFIGLKKSLQPVLAPPIPDGFDLMAWIDSKIENKSMTELMKKKRKTE